MRVLKLRPVKVGVSAIGLGGVEVLAGAGKRVEVVGVGDALAVAVRGKPSAIIEWGLLGCLARQSPRQ